MQSGQASTAPRHVVLLDAARSVAALAVVCWHWQNFTGYLGPQHSPLAQHALPFFSYFKLFYTWGWLAVDFFFMLSGFVMALVYLDAIKNRVTSAPDFAMKRFSRLYPLHFATLIFIASMQMLWYIRNGAIFNFPSFSSNFYDIYHFLLQVFFASQWGIQRGPSFNDPAWSVSIEILLYAYFYLAVRFIKKLFPAMICFGLIGFVLYAANLSNGIGRGVLCFSIGVSVFTILRHLNGTMRGQIVFYMCPIIIFGASIVYFSNIIATVSSGVGEMVANALGRPAMESNLADRLDRIITYSIWVGAICPSIIIILDRIDNAFRKFFRPLAMLGAISYSSYMLHFPMQLAAAMLFGPSKIAQPGWVGDLNFMIFFAVLIIISFASHYFFEIPVQKHIRSMWLKKFSRSVSSNIEREA